MYHWAIATNEEEFHSPTQIILHTKAEHTENALKHA